MRIKRVLDGKEYEIELTLPEMNSAYFERRNAFDHEDVITRLNDMFEDDDLSAYADVFSEEEIRGMINAFVERWQCYESDRYPWWDLCAEAICDELDDQMRLKLRRQ